MVFVELNRLRARLMHASRHKQASSKGAVELASKLTTYRHCEWLYGLSVAAFGLEALYLEQP